MKKYLGICIVLWLLVLAVIPVNIYLISMSDIVIVVCVAAVIASLILFLIKAPCRKRGKIIVSITSVVIIFVFLMAGYVCNPYWNSVIRHNESIASKPYNHELSAKEAQEDLKVAVRYLKKIHPACYHGLPKDLEERYEEAITDIRACESISVNDLSRYIERIFSPLHDGHTFASTIDRADRYLKYVYSWDGDGYEITAVNGTAITELLRQKSDLYSFECESWELLDLNSGIISISGLDYLDIDFGEGITYTITNDDGNSRDIVCHDEDFLSYDEYCEYNEIESSSDEDYRFVSYEIDEERSLAVLTLDSCIINNEYRDTVRAMFTEVKEKDIRNVAVDVRYNSGGNDAVVTEFFRYLDIDEYRICTCDWRLGPLMIDMDRYSANQNDRIEDLLFHGNLYILTTANTFSSAMIFAQYIRDNDLGTIIGQAPGNDPNGYGDISEFMLPNSGIYMQISTKKWYRADKNAPEGLIEPDIVCDVEHREDAMNALYEAISMR